MQPNKKYKMEDVRCEMRPFTFHLSRFKSPLTKIRPQPAISYNTNQRNLALTFQGSITYFE